MDDIMSFLVYIMLGGSIGFIFYFLFGKSCLGKIYGSIIVGIIGSILGDYILRNPIKKSSDFLLETFDSTVLQYITNLFYKKYGIVFFAAILGSIILIWILNLISVDKQSE